MSCTTQTQQPVKFIVSMGSLPEGFCGTPQELAQAIADRLLIQSDPVYSSFAIGSTAPTSNVGPWLKDCQTWYVWDDALAIYRPITKEGFNKFVVFDVNGSFTVPDGIYSLLIEAWGGGGGGANEFSGSSESGGGGGGYGMVMKPVNPGDSVVFTVGVGGAGGAAGTNGGDTVILGMTAAGGKGAVVIPSGKGGVGGLVTASDMGIQGGAGKLTISGGGGSGGDSPRGGQGGRVDSALGTQQNGILPGGGGAGGTVSNNVGGNGANGRIIIHY